MNPYNQNKGKYWDFIIKNELFVGFDKEDGSFIDNLINIELYSFVN